MTTAIALYDVVGYSTGDKPEERAYASKGDKIELSESEFKRLSELDPPAVATPKEAEKMLAESVRESITPTGTDQPPAAPVTDDALAGMSVQEVAVHLQQHPEDLDRLRTVEDQREAPRKTVLDLFDRHAAAMAEEAEKKKESGSS